MGLHRIHTKLTVRLFGSTEKSAQYPGGECGSPYRRQTYMPKGEKVPRVAQPKLAGERNAHLKALSDLPGGLNPRHRRGVDEREA